MGGATRRQAPEPKIPVRGQHKVEVAVKKQKASAAEKPARISGYDWEAWEKFNVDSDEDEEDKKPVGVNDKGLAERRAEVRAERIARLRDELDTEELPDDIKVFLAERERRKGNEAYRTKDFDEAKEAYARSLAYREDARVYANRALVALSVGNLEEAEADCDAALELDSVYDKARARRAVTRYKRGKYKAALDDFALVQNSDAKIDKLAEMAKTKLAEEDAKAKARTSPFVRVTICDEDEDDGVRPPSGARRIAIQMEEEEDDDDDEEEDNMFPERPDEADGLRRIPIANVDDDEDAISHEAPNLPIIPVADARDDGATFSNSNDKISEMNVVAQQADKDGMYSTTIPEDDGKRPCLSDASRKVETQQTIPVVHVDDDEPTALALTVDTSRQAQSSELHDEVGLSMNVKDMQKADLDSNPKPMKIEEDFGDTDEGRLLAQSSSPKSGRRIPVVDADEEDEPPALALKADASRPVPLSEKYDATRLPIDAHEKKGANSPPKRIPNKGEGGSHVEPKNELFCDSSLKAETAERVEATTRADFNARALYVSDAEAQDSSQVAVANSTESSYVNEETRRAAAEAVKAQGTQAIKSGDFARAVTLYSESLGILETVAARNNRCLALIKLERWDEAISDATAVLSVEPRNPKALFRRGLAHRGRGDRSAAVEDLTKLGSLEPGNKLAKEELRRTKRMGATRQTLDFAEPKPDLPRPPAPNQSLKVVEVEDNAIPLPPPVAKTNEESYAVSHEQRAARATAIATKRRAPTKLPLAANSSFELERVWRDLRNDHKRQAAYISSFTPVQLKKVVAPTLDIFGEIALRITSIDDKLKAARLLVGASQAKSFDIVQALLTSDHAEAIRNLASHVQCTQEHLATKLRVGYSKLLQCHSLS